MGRRWGEVLKKVRHKRALSSLERLSVNLMQPVCSLPVGWCNLSSYLFSCQSVCLSVCTSTSPLNPSSLSLSLHLTIHRYIINTYSSISDAISFSIILLKRPFLFWKQDRRGAGGATHKTQWPCSSSLWIENYRHTMCMQYTINNKDRKSKLTACEK